MKTKSRETWREEGDGLLLRVLPVLALVLLIFLFMMRPAGYRSDPPPVSSDSQGLVVERAPSAPVIREIPPPKANVAADTPVFCLPPAVAWTPMPTPTPAGGGVLRRIAFASNRGDGRHYQLYMMDADGNHLERLTHSQAFDRDPHFSYDGTQLAFSSNRSGNYEIYVLDLETRDVKRLTRGGGDKSNPFWSPDNHHVLFTWHRGGTSELGIMRADGTHMRMLTDQEGDSHGYGFSPDGRYISYESTVNDRNEIFLYDLESRRSELLLETDDVSYRGDPVFSPVGDKLVFSSDVIARKLRQLYIYDIQWDRYYRVTDDAQDKDDPIFSPDGSKIAYVARWENAWNVYVMDADGRHARNVTRSYYDHVVPTWR